MFGVDGTPNTNNGGCSFAYLGFSCGASQANFSTTSLLPQLWATDPMPVVWVTGVQTNADINTNWQYNLIQDDEQVRDARERLLLSCTLLWNHRHRRQPVRADGTVAHVRYQMRLHILHMGRTIEERYGVQGFCLGP